MLKPTAFQTHMLKKTKEKAVESNSTALVGVSGLEPEASWSRTKRDTKLRHTPIGALKTPRVSSTPI